MGRNSLLLSFTALFSLLPRTQPF